jgi:hypothetical protein
MTASSSLWSSLELAKGSTAQLFVAVHESVPGTKRTNRVRVLMSVDRSRPEAIDAGSK